MPVFMPIKGIAGFQEFQQATPLSFKDDDTEMLILYTSNECA